MLFIWIPILILYFFSFKIWSWKNDWLLTLFIIYCMICTLPFWGAPRFRFPIDPFIIFRSITGIIILLKNNRMLKYYL